MLEIYQRCRSEAEISSAFERLQRELDEQIQIRLGDTRKMLFEHFDEEVHERLKLNLDDTKVKLDRIARLFWLITQYILNGKAEFDDYRLSFNLNQSPVPSVAAGHYHLVSKNHENKTGDFLYRLSHPLGEYVIEESKKCICPEAELSFDISGHGTKIAVIEELKGQCGWLALQHMQIDSFGSEEYLLFSGLTDDGKNIGQQVCEKLFNCMAETTIAPEFSIDLKKQLNVNMMRHVEAVLSKNLEENNKHFAETRDKLDKWAEDKEASAQKELDDVKRQIRDLQRHSRQATTMEEQRNLQESIVKLERKKRSLRSAIFDIEDQIAAQRDQLLDALEKRMKQKSSVKTLFIIRWRVV